MDESGFTNITYYDIEQERDVHSLSCIMTFNADVQYYAEC